MTPSPADQWVALKADILRQIEAIDKATPWSEVEPRWWLEMVGIRDDLLHPNPDDPARVGLPDTIATLNTMLAEKQDRIAELGDRLDAYAKACAPLVHRHENSPQSPFPLQVETDQLAAIADAYHGRTTP